MKKIFIIGIVLIIQFSSYGYCQSTFKNVYPGFSGGSGGWNTSYKQYNNENSFLILGTGSCIKLIKTDATGNILLFKQFQTGSGFCNDIIENDKIIISLGQGHFKHLYILDTSLNYLTSKRYDSINYDTLNLGLYSFDRNIIKPTFDKGYIMSGCKNKTYAAIIKSDSNVNIKWSKYFSPVNGMVQDIIQTQDSGFIIAANLKNLGASLIKTDSSGNVLWSKSYFRPRGYIHNVLENTDGTIIITGNTDSLSLSGSEYNSSPYFFVKLDSIGNVLWAKTFGDAINRIRNYPSDTKHTQDGGYITLATLAINDWLDDLFLIKTNAYGDTMWVRAHGSPQSFDNGQSVEQLNDKGYILSGLTNNNIPVPLSSLYIVSTDSLGHTDSLCEEYSPSIAVNNITVNDSNITVFSIPFIVQVGLPDTINAFYTTYAYDGCHLDEIPELYLEQTAPLLIYPNPSDGLFSIEMKMNIPIKTNIEIYDINSRKVYNGTTTESVSNIDLTGNARGLYFIRMSNERWIKTGKVMLQ